MSIDLGKKIGKKVKQKGFDMKLAHLSDLHLGKRLNEFSLLEDQRYILGQILNRLEEQAVDGVILAGDLYDKSVPSAEAVRLFDWFLTRLAEKGLPVYAISGNHDSMERIAFGAELMDRHEVYFNPIYDGSIKTVEKEDEFGRIQIHLLPFLKPAMVRQMFPEERIESYEDAIRVALAHGCAGEEPLLTDASVRHILVAHQFVTGASCCDSEELYVGGLDQISADLFEGFDYVALGHIHSPQRIGRETVRYSGTPLKYSFSEANQTKSVPIVELKEKGNVEITFVELTPLRDLRTIRGTYLEVTNREFYQQFNPNDYVHITLTDEEDILEGMAKLRTIYPNLMSLSYDNRRTRVQQRIEGARPEEQKTSFELMSDFFLLQNNQEMNEAQKECLMALLEELGEIPNGGDRG